MIRRFSRGLWRSRLLLLCAAIAVVVSAPLASATVDPPAGDQVAEPVPHTAAVVIDGVELFRVRGASSYPAEQRARAIAERIAAFARDPSLDPSSLRIEESELGLRLTWGDGSQTLMNVVESDARLEAVEPVELATIVVARVRTAIGSYRTLRSPEHLLRSAILTGAATLVLAMLWLAGRWAFRRLDRAISRHIEGTVERLRIQSFRLLSPDQAWRLLRSTIRTLRLALALILLYAYLDFSLSLFPWTRGFAIGMLHLVLNPLLVIGRGLLSAVPDLVFLVVLALVTRFLLRLIRLFFLELDRGVLHFEGFDPDWAMPTYRLVRLLVIAFAVIVAFPYIPGSDSGAFKGVTIFAGVLFSLGSSSVIGNVIAGYTMTYRRAFRDGDRIRVGDVVGEVTRTRLLVTIVRTAKNEEVVIPNSVILTSPVVNYSALARDGGLILHTAVGIGYEVPWRQVEAMLLLAAERTGGLLREPPPFVLQTALGDFAVTYELNVHCDAPSRAPQLSSDLHRSILDLFNEYGVQIMTPAYEGDTPEPKLVPREQWYAAPARPPDGGR